MGKKDTWQRRIIGKVTVAELAAWLFYHFFWGGFFFVVMILSYRIMHPWTQLKGITLDIVVKMLWGLPVWWLLLTIWEKRSLLFVLIFHIIYIPIFSFGWVYSFGFLLNLLGWGKFDFATMMYDVYVCAFFYSLQFAIFHAYRFYLRTRQQQIREQALKDLAYQSEIKALKAQIEPHFLFNTLNSISASVPPSLEKTRVLIAQLADTFRYALQVSERQSVTLEEELAFIQTWLALEHHRFGHRLQVDYHIDPRVLNTSIPPLILQPLIENALNHGISPLIDGGTVSITCQQDVDFVQITISDTGVGYETDLDEIFTKGFGVKSTAERIERLYQEKLVVKRNPRGLRFMFRVPME